VLELQGEQFRGLLSGITYPASRMSPSSSAVMCAAKRSLGDQAAIDTRDMPQHDGRSTIQGRRETAKCGMSILIA